MQELQGEEPVEGNCMVHRRIWRRRGSWGFDLGWAGGEDENGVAGIKEETRMRMDQRVTTEGMNGSSREAESGLSLSGERRVREKEKGKGREKGKEKREGKRKDGMQVPTMWMGCCYSYTLLPETVRENGGPTINTNTPYAV